MDPASTAEGDTIMYAVKSGEILAPERSGTGLLLAGWRPAGNRRGPGHRAAGPAGTAISAVADDVNGSDQALHADSIPGCASRRGLSSAVRNAPARQGICRQGKIPTT